MRSTTTTYDFGETAGELFRNLFKLSKKHVDIEGGYVPMPLIDKLSKVSYRLRPETCLTIPILYSRDEIEYIRIPSLLDDEYIPFIAHYVCGRVLNRAMSIGFDFCELVTEGLPDKWKEAIENAYRENGYSALNEDFLSNFQTERTNNVNLSAEIHPKTILPTPISELAEVLNRYFDKNRGKEPLFLGIDVGGGFIKFQCYRYNFKEGKWHPQGKPHKILTACSKRNYTNSEGQYRNAKAFAERLIEEITRSFAQEKIGSEQKQIQPGEILAVGIAWPGAVRDNRIAGVSRIVWENFEGFSGDRNITTSELMELDIVGAFKSVWQEKVKDSNLAVVAMANDGTVDAAGVMFSDPKLLQKKKGTFAILKAGTGSAGGIVRDGRLIPELLEFGKFLLNLDLAGKSDENYPNGVVNAYCSRRTLPQLAKDRAPHLQLIDNLDSFEIGRMLDCNPDILANPNNWQTCEKTLRELQIECGAHEFARRSVLEALRDPQQVKADYYDEKLRPPQQFEIERLGEIRLIKLFNLQTYDEFEQLSSVLEGEGLAGKDQLQTKLEEAYKLASECAKTLGKYIGDIIALLHNMFKIEMIVLGGGVMSESTGKIAREIAKVRLEKLHGIGSVEFYEKTDTTEEAESLDSGTLGAVVIASREFIFDQERRGIAKFRQEILRLPLNQMIRLDDNEVNTIADEPLLQLSEYALTKADLQEYLREYISELGFGYIKTDKDGEIYRRWSDEPIGGGDEA